jgi:hypothetical protein
MDESDDRVDAIVYVNQIEGAVACLDRRAPMPPLERIEAWQAAADALATFQVVVGQMAADAQDAMVQLGTKQLTTRRGPCHLARSSSSQEWRGYELLGKLADPMIEPSTGEVMDAVPLQVLRDVIAGCNKPDSTYSKWLTTGLKEWLPDDWRKFVTYHDPRDVIKLGEKRR